MAPRQRNLEIKLCSKHCALGVESYDASSIFHSLRLAASSANIPFLALNVSCFDRAMETAQLPRVVYTKSEKACGSNSQNASFVAMWPLRGPLQSGYLHTRFSVLLESNVACGDWKSWVLWKCTSVAARSKLDLPQSFCAVCKDNLSTFMCARDTSIRYCSEHKPPRGAGFSTENEESWILLWQTRSPSTISKQKSELRKLWAAARWCPDGAHDYEQMCLVSNYEL